MLSFGEYLLAPWLYYILITVYAITIVAIIAVVLSENRNPVKSLAWVTVLLALPLLGIVLYLFFGRSIKNTRMISRRNRRKLRRAEPQSRIRPSRLGLSHESSRQIVLTRTVCGSSYYPCSDIRIFTDGAAKFESLLKDIEAATSYINIQYYIIEDDNIGTRIRDALIKKANEGVKVRVIYDHVGSFKVKRSFFSAMRDAGIEAYPFFKVSFPIFGTRINWRNHRKICIIDGNIGYIGGMNIADRYIDGGKTFDSWRDTHLRITGTAVSALQYSFAVDWNFMGRPIITDDLPHSVGGPDRQHPEVLQLVSSGPTSQWTAIAMLFARVISSAKRRVYLQTPYFLPSESLLHALQSASLSGVDVRIMIPHHSDSHMLDLASSSFFKECMQAGIKIYLYKAGMLHSKLLLVDDEFVSIGSANFDFRSFEHNFEANMQIYSKQFNERIAEIYHHDIESCHRLRPADWRKRPLYRKALESIVRLLSPVL